MAHPVALLKRTLIFVHRWLGVALSVIFMLWFVSGIVMMYWSFPAVSAGDRLTRAPVLRAEQICFTPEEAWTGAGREGSPAQVRLSSFDGRPVYRFAGGGDGRRGGSGRGGGGGLVVYADDGLTQQAVDDAMVDRAATAWTRLPLDGVSKESVEEVDQWTIAGGLRNLRPLYKYTFPDGQQVYVNGTTAEVVQYTTTSSRFWAWLGAIPHWMYFTPLRKHQQAWFSFVVYSSLVGTIAALLGVVVAVWMYSPRKRYRHAGMPTSIPYRGWKRWHTIVGLLFGVITTTWAFSGLLSMGPFPILQTLTDLTVPADAPSSDGRPQRPVNLPAALRGSEPPIEAYAAKGPALALASIRDFGARELELTAFAGAPVYLATNADGDTRIVPIDGPPRDAFDPQTIMTLVREAAGDRLAELRLMDEYDAYYLDRRREAPLPVVFARLNDAAGTRHYIDPGTGRVVGSYSARGWVSRWLYHGLHSLDLPFLYKYRPLWDIVVITLMLGGTAVCVTSLVLTWQVLARKLRTLLGRLARPSDDLAMEP